MGERPQLGRGALANDTCDPQHGEAVSICLVAHLIAFSGRASIERQPSITTTPTRPTSTSGRNTYPCSSPAVESERNPAGHSSENEETRHENPSTVHEYWYRPLSLLAVMALTACTAGTAPTEEPVVTNPPPATTTPSTTVGTFPPQAVGSGGRFHTPLGPVEWQHLAGTAESLPYPDGGVVSTPNGYLAISYQPDPTTGELTGYTFWRSPDGYEWERGSSENERGP
jgi:hypothetical protein